MINNFNHHILKDLCNNRANTTVNNQHNSTINFIIHSNVKVFSENLKRLEDHIQPQHHQLSQQQPLIGQGNHQPPGQHVHLDHYNNQRTQFKSYQHYPHDQQHNRGESLPISQISAQVPNDFNQQQQKELVAPTVGQQRPQPFHHSQQTKTHQQVILYLNHHNYSSFRPI